MTYTSWGRRPGYFGLGGGGTAARHPRGRSGRARVRVTHDRNTIPGFAYDRVRALQVMTGVVVVDDRQPLGRLIDELLVVVVCSDEGELRDQVIYVPMGFPHVQIAE